MEMPSITGIRILNKKQMPMPVPTKSYGKLPETKIINGRKKSIRGKSEFIQDVTMLMNGYNDRAFIYDSGKVDIIKNGNIKTVKFKTKNVASVYLMKLGWKYV